MSEYDLFLQNHVPPKTYKDALDKAFGEEWTAWEPETIVQELFRVFRVVPIYAVREKIFALQTFLVTHAFWDSVLTFEDIVLAFGDRYVDPGLLQGCLPEELAYGVVVANQVQKAEFSSDVSLYIRSCHHNAGVLVYHEALRFAQPAYEGENARIAAAVEKLLAAGAVPPKDINQDDPVQVQFAKTWDVAAYTQERIERGT